MENFGFVIELIKTYGYWVVGIGIFLECMGVPFPGETSLILGGVAASLGHLNLALVIIIASFAAVLGDNMGYFVGKKFGRKIIKKFEHFPLFHYKHIDRAEKFFKAHGNKTVFIGRFTAILRTYSALFAGIFDMHYSTFFIYNFTGGVLWSLIFGFVGYFIGNNIPLIEKIIVDFNTVFFILVGVVIALLVGRWWWNERKTKKNPEMRAKNTDHHHAKTSSHKTSAPITHPSKKPGRD